jgi:hypothetical protein
MVIWGIGKKGLKVVGVFNCAVLFSPFACIAELLVADHVQNWGYAKYCSEKVRILRHGGCHEKPRVRTTEDGQPIGLSNPSAAKPTSSGDKVVECDLPFTSPGSLVPLASEL